MKKILCSWFMLLLLFAVSPLYAMDYILGVKGGYFFWEPSLKKSEINGFSQMDKGSGALYGPVFSVIFTPEISLSLSGLMGEQGTSWQTSRELNSQGKYVSGDFSFNSKRYDLDGALSYRLGESFKVFAGYKYMYLKSRMQYTEFRVDSNGKLEEVNIDDGEFKQPSHGPALGLGISIPLSKGYFFAVNLSGLYMKGKLEIQNKEYGGYESSNFTTPKVSDKDRNLKFDTEIWGGNLEPSVGVNMGEGMPIVTLGVRYQWLRIKYKSNTTQDALPSKAMNDKVYGVFVGVMYQI